MHYVLKVVVRGRGGGVGRVVALACAEHLNMMNHLLQSSTVFKIHPNAKILHPAHLKILHCWNSPKNGC